VDATHNEEQASARLDAGHHQWHHAGRGALLSGVSEGDELQSRGSGRSNDPPSSTEVRPTSDQGLKSTVSPSIWMRTLVSEEPYRATAPATMGSNTAQTEGFGLTSGPLPSYKSQTGEGRGGSGSHNPSARRSHATEAPIYMVEASPVPQYQLQDEEDLERRRQSSELTGRSSNSEKMARQSQSQQQQERDSAAEAAAAAAEKRRKTILFCALFLVLIVVAIAAAVGGLCGAGYCSHPQSPATSRPSPATKTPSLAPVVLTRELLIANLINDRTLTGSEIQYPPPTQDRTPEEQALFWLISEDRAGLPSSQTDRLVVRYVLSLLWYKQIIPRADAFAVSWLQGDDECDWEGIICRQNVVDSIQINVNNTAKGKLPSDIGLLTALTFLTLISNMTGPIPSTIGLLTDLSSLGLEQNKLTGMIPSELSALTKLTRLGLFENGLIGPIPDFSLLTDLQSLALYNNGLTGSIPSAIGGLTSLMYLGLHENILTGNILDLGSLTLLQSLVLSDNKLAGSIPSSIGLMTSLTSLFLDGLMLSGTIPSELSKMSRLVNLFLHTNKLKGTIPGLSALTNLETLSLGENALTGSIPGGVESLTKLVNLGVYNNGLKGTIPNIAALTDLKLLVLSNNALTGSILSGVESLTGLISFEVNANRLTGKLPDLRALTLLKTLWFSENLFTSTIPATWGGLTSLTELSLYGNPVTGTVPTELMALTALKLALFINTELNGTLPFCLVPDLLPFEKLIADCNELDCPCCTLCCPEAGWNGIPGWISNDPDEQCES
jgi:Leucine-rich repeat (LRR) protein